MTEDEKFEKWLRRQPCDICGAGVKENGEWRNTVSHVLTNGAHPGQGSIGKAFSACHRCHPIYENRSTAYKKSFYIVADMQAKRWRESVSDGRERA